MRPREIAVVGASLAGLRAVDALRKRGFDGTITWIGAEAELPYDRPPLSKQILRGEWEPARTALKANYDALGVDLRLGTRATRLDLQTRAVELEGGARVPFDGLVIATGAKPRMLRGADGLSGVFTLRTLRDALAVKQALERRPRVAIIGAGFIGLEVAASCRTLGLDVTVLETLDAPLAPAIGSEMGQAIAEMHRERGVRLRTGVAVRGFEGSGSVSALRLSDGTTEPADLVIVGIGVTPETGWLESSGLALGDGVLCDERCAASADGVVACGDVARFKTGMNGATVRIEHWSNAVEQAAAAVARLLDGPSAPRFTSVPYFWSDQYDAKIQFAGRRSPDDTLRIVEGSVAERNLVAHYGRAGKLTAVLTVNKPAAFIRGRKAIGDAADF
jgi:3-phenylpropionate/trans-cinnamate dioxygenase ferredoxin reductase component